MFNQGRFNLQSFNLVDAHSADIIARAEMGDHVSGSISANIDIQPNNVFEESFDAFLEATRETITLQSVELLGIVNAAAGISMDHFITAEAMAETTHVNVNITHIPYITFEMNESFGQSISAFCDYKAMADLTEATGASSSMFTAYLAPSVSMEENIYNASAASMLYVMQAVQEAFGQSASAFVDYTTLSAFNEAINSSTMARIDVHANAMFTEIMEFSKDARLASDFSPRFSMSVKTHSSAIMFYPIEKTIRVTVPFSGLMENGKTGLVLDSDLYTATKDGVNCIDKHTGTWLMLSRNTYKIRIAISGAASSSIYSKLQYDERWI